MAFAISLAKAVNGICIQFRYICVWCHGWATSYIAKLWAKYYNLEQNIEHNRLELPERKIDENKSKIGSSLVISYVCVYCLIHDNL